ncbi:fizzy-related protein homolog isoform X2 [Corythoichthys intestinalis]|uniref:fizzy-related protein homolog isoform X2 n=1 Tax=Corythoichthys intestinalis TaxID=161448 RepID=UPI0025A66DEE|nr:fizzy-related protein homolog isoform X2 [Corythoichthys intestinalis]
MSCWVRESSPCQMFTLTKGVRPSALTVYFGSLSTLRECLSIAITKFHPTLFLRLLTRVTSCYVRFVNRPARSPRSPSRCWTPRNCRTTSTSTWSTGRRETYSVLAWEPASTCGVPAPARLYGKLKVTRLCDLSVDGDSVTSVCWNERGSLVAVGTHKGYVQIWDAAGGRKLSTLEGHSARVGALAWNGEQLSSGSRDRVILQRDIRTPPSAEKRLQGHRQEVCGLKWSPDHQHLASGGNDNKLLVWNSSSLLPVQQYSDHVAAVKAIAWSPHQHGLLASGGGTADRCLRFWNTLTGQALQSTDTGSQVCNLAWSKHANELVSTHGYSQNQILVWKYPSLAQVAKLTGHSYRVLYLAVSPDGEAIVTGAGDETLRFWNIFTKTRCTKESKSVLNLFTRIR